MKNRTSRSNHTESEIALVIKNSPDHIAKDIAGLTSIIEYDLEPIQSERIHDSYYDRADGALRRQMISFRVRKFDHKRIFSMKSNPRRIIESGTRRRELELSWAYSSLVRLTRELELERPRRPSRFSDLTANEILTPLGLQLIQERITMRDRRNVFPRTRRRRSLLAELSIDQVTYLHEAAKVRLFEIEIEAKSSGALRGIRKIVRTLESLYPESLMEWVHGKFITGLAIRRLLETRQLQEHIEHFHLKPEAFAIIDRTIRSTRL